MNATVVAEFLELREILAPSSTLTKSLQASFATMFLYYCLTHLDEEIEYIWKRPWSASKLVYLLTRYSGLTFVILVLISVSPIRWNDFGYFLDPSKYSRAEFLEVGICFGGHLYIIFGTLIYILAQSVLAMRIYALYERRKRVLVISMVLIVLTVGALQVFGAYWLLFKASSECIGTSCMSKKLAVPIRMTITCTDASPDITYIGWGGACLVEFAFFGMVWWKCRQLKRVGTNCGIVGEIKTQPYARDIIGLMARDSLNYFLRILAVCFAGTCLNLLAILTEAIPKLSKNITLLRLFFLQNTILTGSLLLMAVLAPKLLLNIRMEYYGPVGSLAENTRRNWDISFAPADDIDEDETEVSRRDLSSNMPTNIVCSQNSSTTGS